MASGTGPPDTRSAPAENEDSGAILRRVGRIAGWSVAVGLALEIVQLAILLAHDKMPVAVQAFSDAGSKITWSTGMCGALAAGLAAARSRPRLPGLPLMFGALAAPLVFVLARAVHKGLSNVLSAAPGPSDPVSPWLLAALKAVEYGLFGLAIERVALRSGAPLRTYVAVGLSFGAVFAALIVTLAATGDTVPPRPALVTRGATELLFPVGCALVLYTVERAAAVVRRN